MFFYSTNPEFQRMTSRFKTKPDSGETFGSSPVSSLVFLAYGKGRHTIERHSSVLFHPTEGTKSLFQATQSLDFRSWTSQVEPANSLQSRDNFSRTFCYQRGFRKFFFIYGSPSLYLLHLTILASYLLLEISLNSRIHGID